jgi:hypothetical protein
LIRLAPLGLAKAKGARATANSRMECLIKTENFIWMIMGEAWSTSLP